MYRGFFFWLVSTRGKHDVDPMLAHRLRWAGLVLLNTADNDYKPTPTQCLLNVGPASPVLDSIHLVLVSTSCWGRKQGNICIVKTIPDIKKNCNIIFTIIWKFKIYIFSSSDHPANKRNKPTADLMPVHRLQRRSGTKSTQGQCVESTEQ